MTEERREYERAMFYTVEITPSITFEIDRLDAARDLFRDLRLARCNSDATLNLVVWTGRSGRDGGPPRGVILDQATWQSDGE